jgi:hypothetical protein
MDDESLRRIIFLCVRPSRLIDLMYRIQQEKFLHIVILMEQGRLKGFSYFFRPLLCTLTLRTFGRLGFPILNYETLPNKFVLKSAKGGIYFLLPPLKVSGKRIGDTRETQILFDEIPDMRATPVKTIVVAGIEVSRLRPHRQSFS